MDLPISKLGIECSGGENGKNVVEGSGLAEERRGCYMEIMRKFVTLSHISAAAAYVPEEFFCK